MPQEIHSQVPPVGAGIFVAALAALFCPLPAFGIRSVVYFGYGRRWSAPVRGN